MHWTKRVNHLNYYFNMYFPLINFCELLPKNCESAKFIHEKMFPLDLEKERLSRIVIVILTIQCIMSQNSQAHFKNLEAIAARFLKCI